MSSAYESNEQLFKQRGAVLLEHAVTLPLFIVLLLGFADLSHWLYARTALHAAVATALRCMTTIEGACAIARPTDSLRLFDVSEIETRSAYRVATYSYRAEAQWLSGPVFSFPAPQATVLDAVHFTARQTGYRAVRTLHQLEGEVRYFLQTMSGPYISGDPLAPKLLNGPDGKPYANDLSHQIHINLAETVRGAINRRFEDGDGDAGVPIGSSDWLTLQPPFGAMPCFRSSQIDRAGPHEMTTPAIPCDPRRTAIVLLINGSAAASDAHSIGKVTLQLEERGGTRRNLGGRLITAGGNDDFVARGARRERLSASIRAAYPTETRLYDEITVPYGVPFRLNFRLQSSNARRVAWRGSSLTVLLPSYESRVEAVKCQGEFSTRQIAEKNSLCTSGHAADPATIVRSVGARREVRETQCMPRGRNSEALLTAAGILDSQAEDFTLEEDPTHPCPLGAYTISCGDNQGVRDPHPEDPLVDHPEARSLCPPDSHDAEGVYWTERTHTLVDGGFDWRPLACDQLFPELHMLPEKLQRYPKLRLAAPSISSRTAVALLSEQSPQLAKQTPRYACSSFRLHSLILDQEGSGSEDLFSRPQQDLGCDWQIRLRNAALEKGIPEEAAFQFARHSAGETLRDTAPTDPCTEFAPLPLEAAVLRRLGVFREDRLPEICRTTPPRCRLEYRGMVTNLAGDERRRGSAESEVRAERATQVAQEALKSFIPALDTDGTCGSPPCARVSAREDEGVAKVSAEVALRSYLLKPFGQEIVRLHYSRTRPLEVLLWK